MLVRIPKLASIALLAPLMLSVSDVAVDASTSFCSAEEVELPLDSESGSASFLHNMSGHPDSLSAVAQRLLHKALAGEAAPAPRDCEPDCPPNATSEVVYRVTPIEFLAPERQHDVCLRFESETTAEPLRFEEKRFDTVEDLNTWIMDFSQGKGDEGKKLYAQCSSNCSPRYTFLIAQHNAQYQVRTEVLCGLARDKSNNQYRITTALRWTCAVN